MCRRAVRRRADTVRRLHEDRKQDKLMQICISPLMWVAHREFYERFYVGVRRRRADCQFVTMAGRI